MYAPLLLPKALPVASKSSPQVLPPPSAKSSNRRVAGMIAPDPLLELVAADPGRDGAPLRAVEPAVGPPGHRVDGRVARPGARSRSSRTSGSPSGRSSRSRSG